MLAGPARGDSDVFADARKQLQPAPVTLKGDGLSLAEALASLHEQTGNRVYDRRQVKDDRKLKLDLARVTFWPALDDIAAAAGASVSLYQPDGVVALVDGSRRPQPVAYSGLFRITAKRLTVAREAGRGTGTCVVDLDVAWEPRFQPFYLEQGAVEIVFSKDDDGKVLREKQASRGQISVVGHNAVEVKVQVPAPRRSSQRIDSIQGEFKLLGPARMLQFVFESLTSPKKDVPVSKKVEGVTVSLESVVTSLDHWKVDVMIENPAGSPRFESYQSWWDNNTIRLEKGEGKSKQVFLPSGENETPTARGICLQYQFRERGRAPAGQPGDWRLVYSTPGPMVEVAAPFELKALLLP
jgi:hypothetical protein